jgi:hypothetical protein
MAGMGGGMGGQMGGSLMQAGIQGAQNTNNQELAQRQMLFQNMKAAMDDSEWLRQHYPNFFNWTPSGSGGGGYDTGANAPMVSAKSTYSMPSSQKESGMDEYYRSLIQKDQEKGKPDSKPTYSYADTAQGQVVRAPDNYYQGGMTSSGMGYRVER